MFVCRVMVGETSQGSNEQLVPEVRVEATQQQYDSTTDSSTDKVLYFLITVFFALCICIAVFGSSFTSR